MQTRTCFNGGELSPEMVARVDVDAYMRGARVAENWQIGQMGGVTRRRGMRGVVKALGEESRLYAYSYSAEWGHFVVEVHTRVVRVLSGDGVVHAQFVAGVNGCPEFHFTRVRVLQLNAVLLLTAQDCWPMELRLDEAGKWSLRRVEFTHLPWRYEERRDAAVEVSMSNVLGVGAYDVVLPEGVDAAERELLEGDTLRVSFWTECAEGYGGELYSGVDIVSGVQACSVGRRIAQYTEPVTQYWVCKKEFPSDVYVAGLDDPGCYPDNFEKPEVTSGFSGAKVVASVKDLGTCTKGTKFVIKTGYWEYYTCIRAFAASDIKEGLGYGDYPGHFVRGIAVGGALACKGKWQFYCSGLWYGSYEVLRSYDERAGGGLAAAVEWESAGISFSRLGEPSNELLAGDEGDEACWLQLVLTRSKYMTAGKLEDGFPPAGCGNRLIVDGYKHDLLLRYEAGKWVCVNVIRPALQGVRTVYDWSWAAWSERYGYPAACEVYGQRLVFASSAAQPQTVWMSQTDDLFNFATGDSDDSAIVRTLYTTTQQPIGWLLESNGRLMLGTSDAEWTISVPSGQAVTPTNMWVTRHGRVGCQEGLCLPVDDKALFVQRGGGRLWAYGYSFEIDGCRSEDLTVFAPHVLREHGGAVSATLLEAPDTVAVFALADGQVALCTYNTMHQVHAWHRWVTDGRVLSVAALPDGNRADRLFLLVERDGEVWIEVVDEDSPYCDRDGRAYTSTLVSTPLYNPLEQAVQKAPRGPVKVLFGADCVAADLEVCADGGSWCKVASQSAVFTVGWHDVLTVNRWTEAPAVGLRYVGEGCKILAIQG